MPRPFFSRRAHGVAVPGGAAPSSRTAASGERRFPAPGVAAERLRPQRWREPRFVAGLVLVMVSVVLGARLVGSGPAGTAVWAAAKPLAAGTTIGAADLVPVRLDGDASAYVAATAVPTGVLHRDLAAGELLPQSALALPAADRRYVTVAVQPSHAPADLGHGDRIDLWVTPADDAGSSVAVPKRALAGAVVAAVSTYEGLGSGDLAVVLDVAEADAGVVVAAVRSGAIDLVRVTASDGVR
ncbi:MAG: hypothetical protein EPO13_08030 [Actinomycetota bacterium]|nr:MAG: hypothetical protein EPO13_08030 [Actinomycetota bacterium]